MQFATLLIAFGLSSTAFAAAVNTPIPGIPIRHDDAPVATDLAITQVAVEEVEKRDLDKRAEGHLYFCTAYDFKGKCQNVAFTTNVCYDVFAQYDNSISSARPEKGYICRLFEDKSCKGRSETIVYPGVAAFDSEFNDRISSYRCYNK